MITAVMQPYLFPYIGYYQLVYASDYFVFYDDVTFIKQGYINRNNILVHGNKQRVTLPISGASSNVYIKDLFYQKSKKLVRTLEQAYSKSQYFDDVFPGIKCILESENRSVSNMNYLSIKYLFDYLGIEKIFRSSSELELSKDMGRAERLIEITKTNNCDHYINSPGGRELYEKEYFHNHGVKLNFLETEAIPYDQGINEFIPSLSIIDIMMHCSKEQIAEMLKNYKLK